MVNLEHILEFKYMKILTKKREGCPKSHAAEIMACGINVYTKATK